MSHKNENISIKDVAKMAGVSTSTVSRVLNSKIGFSEDTEIKVQKAIQQLNYQPNNIARNLKSQTSNLIAFSVPTLWHPYISELLYKIESELNHHSFRTVVSSNSNDPKQEKEFLKMARENKVAGIIAISYNEIEPYLETNIPFISIDRYFDTEKFKNVAVVTSDNYQGGKIALRELIRRGAEKIAFLGNYDAYLNNAMDRKKGFLDEAKKYKINIDVFEKPNNQEKNHLLLNSFIENIDKYDGLFVINDETALYLLQKIEHLSINIPNDLQIIGFDGSNYLKDIPSPVTSLVQSTDDIAKASVETLISIIKKQKFQKEIIFPVQFRQGKTTRHFTNNNWF